MRLSWLITRLAASESDSTKLMAPTRSAYSPARKPMVINACMLKESRAASRQAFDDEQKLCACACKEHAHSMAIAATGHCQP